MKALVLKTLHEPMDLEEQSLPEPAEDEVMIALTHAALNHRDVWITKGMYPGIKLPAILGSDGVGEAEGRMVLINPNNHWGDDPRIPGPDYTIRGLETQGTFATHVSVPRHRLVEKPAHLTNEEAAALPLAGLTAYRALAKCEARAGQRALISGIGGGVALMAFQFAMAMGLETWVTSSKPEKIERAIAMGAAGGQLYTEPDWRKKLKKASGGFDVIIDGAGGDGFAELIRLCKRGGQITMYGGTRGAISKINPPFIFFPQISIHGSTMGNDEEFVQMVKLVEKHKIHPVVDRTYPLEQGNEAIAHMAAGLQFGKIVLQIS